MIYSTWKQTCWVQFLCGALKKPRTGDAREFISLLSICSKSVNTELLTMDIRFISKLHTHQNVLEYKDIFFYPVGKLMCYSQAKSNIPVKCPFYFAIPTIHTEEANWICSPTCKFDVFPSSSLLVPIKYCRSQYVGHIIPFMWVGGFQTQCLFLSAAEQDAEARWCHKRFCFRSIDIWKWYYRSVT